MSSFLVALAAVWLAAALHLLRDPCSPVALAPALAGCSDVAGGGPFAGLPLDGEFKPKPFMDVISKFTKDA